MNLLLTTQTPVIMDLSLGSENYSAFYDIRYNYDDAGRKISKPYRVGKEVDGKRIYYLYEAYKVVLEVDEEGNQTVRNVYGG